MDSVWNLGRNLTCEGRKVSCDCSPVVNLFRRCMKKKKAVTKNKKGAKRVALKKRKKK